MRWAGDAGRGLEKVPLILLPRWVGPYLSYLLHLLCQQLAMCGTEEIHSVKQMCVVSGYCG